MRKTARTSLSRSDKALFVNRFGTRMSARSVERMLNKYLKQTGLSQKVTPHTLRHTYATRMLERPGLTIRDVQTLLGHANVATTQVYTHVDEAQLKHVHRKYHPRP